MDFKEIGWEGVVWTPRSYEHGNERSGSIKGREFLDGLSDFQLLKKGPAPWSYFVS
jgi:hypothetical protein